MSERWKAALLSLLLFPTIACAQDTVYPSRTVTMIVPQAAGGANDTIGRIVAQKLAAVLGKSVVVENRPGAGGNIGTAHVAHARPEFRGTDFETYVACASTLAPPDAKLPCASAASTSRRRRSARGCTSARSSSSRASRLRPMPHPTSSVRPSPS